MPLVKFNCPKCHATLKPAKPVPEGKQVKCPKCQELFKAGETAAPRDEPKPDEEEAATYGIIKDEAEERKKAQEEARQQRKLKKKKRKEEDDEDEDEDEDEEEEKKDDILEQYLATVKTKDPRGKAQASIVSPANWLMATGIGGFFGWIFYFVVFLIPIIFPTYEKQDDTAKVGVANTSNDEKSGEKAKKFKFTEETAKEIEKGGKVSADTLNKLRDKKNGILDKEFTYDSFMKKVKDKDVDIKLDDQHKLRKYVEHLFKMDADIHWWSAETIVDEDNEVWSIPLFLCVLLLGLGQAAVICYGAFKMQSLESHQWSTTACVVAMAPLITVPLWVLITFGMDLFNSALEAGWEDITWCFGLVVLLVGPLIGGLALKALVQPHVKAGFEYRGE